MLAEAFTRCRSEYPLVRRALGLAFGGRASGLFGSESRSEDSGQDGCNLLGDNRHTLVTELAESGAGDEVIMSIAGPVSQAMLSRYSHVRMEAKRRALDEIAARQRAADERRNEEVERREQVAAVSQSGVVQ